MFGIVVEYAAGEPGALPDPLERLACRAALVRQPGYRRRLALVAGGWRRVADLFLFADTHAAQATLAGAAGRDLAARCACRDVGPTLLVSARPYGGPVVLFRGRDRGGALVSAAATVPASPPGALARPPPEGDAAGRHTGVRL